MPTTPWAILHTLRPLLFPEKIDASRYADAITVVVFASTAGALLWLLLQLIGGAGRDATPDGPRSAALRRALLGLGVVSVLLLCNQALVNVYLLRHQDAVAKGFGPGWFALATDTAPIRWLSTHLPQEVDELLPYTLLRVQAALELPFVIAAYLSVVGFLSPALARTLWRSPLLPAALVSFTATFCLVELRLWNAYTVSDLRWRWLSCAAGILLWALSRLPAGPARLPASPGGPLRLLSLLLGGSAVAVAVLVLYDVALLYNLLHLWQRLPVLGLCAAAIAAALLLQRRAEDSAGLASAGAVGVLSAFSGVFLLPALAIRYAGDRPCALQAGAAVGIAAGLASLVLAARARPAAPALLGLLVALCAGAGAAYLDHTGQLGLPPLPLPPQAARMLEAQIFRAAALALISGGIAVSLLDGVIALGQRLLRGRRQLPRD